MIFKNRLFIIAGIMLIAAVLRFYHLGQNPASLTWDEVAWGYNAYSLGVDGRDEFGRFLPFDYLESFGDFKPPMYAYLAVIPVKIFGLNEFATRFPSAFFGTLSVLVAYFLVMRLFLESKRAYQYALVASIVLAVSPWHIMLSRGAFEANIATFLIITGVWLFLRWVQEKDWTIVLSAVAFALTFYTFNTPRIFVPMLLLILGIGFRKLLFKYKTQTIAAVCVGILVLLPLVPFLMTPQASLRFREVNIFSDISIIEKTNEQIANDQNAWWSKIIHNRRLAFAGEFIKHYFDNLSPNFLFIKGDGNPKFSTQNQGQMYLWELPFLIVGTLFLIRKRKKHLWIVPLWLVFGIIPAATARETPHALRIEIALPTLQILVAYGIVVCAAFMRRWKAFFIGVLCIIAGMQFFSFLHDYYAHYPKRFSHEWQYGYKDAMQFVNQVKDQYGQINITTHLGRPYIYTLFYTKTDPTVFRNTYNAKREAAGFVTINSFDKYRFGDDVNQLKNQNTKNLFIDASTSVPENAQILETFYTLDGKPILTAYTID